MINKKDIKNFQIFFLKNSNEDFSEFLTWKFFTNLSQSFDIKFSSRVFDVCVWFSAAIFNVKHDVLFNDLVNDRLVLVEGCSYTRELSCLHIENCDKSKKFLLKVLLNFLIIQRTLFSLGVVFECIKSVLKLWIVMSCEENLLSN